MGGLFSKKKTKEEVPMPDLPRDVLELVVRAATFGADSPDVGGARVALACRLFHESYDASLHMLHIFARDDAAAASAAASDPCFRGSFNIHRRVGMVAKLIDGGQWLSARATEEERRAWEAVLDWRKDRSGVPGVLLRLRSDGAFRRVVSDMVARGVLECSSDIGGGGGVSLVHGLRHLRAHLLPTVLELWPNEQTVKTALEAVRDVSMHDPSPSTIATVATALRAILDSEYVRQHVTAELVLDWKVWAPHFRVSNDIQQTLRDHVWADGRMLSARSGYGAWNV
jgi:hypothetical protein